MNKTISNMKDYFTTVFNTIKNDNTFYKGMFGNLMMMTLLIGIAIVIYFSSSNINFVTVNYSTIVFGSIVLASLFVVYAMSTNILRKLGTTLNMRIFAGLALLWTLMLYQTYFSMSYATSKMFLYIYTVLIILAILVFLAILASVFGNYLRSLDGLNGFIAYLIFYIPCMISDFMGLIMKELSMTGYDVYALYAVEIVLVFLLFYMKPMMKSIISTGGKEILNQPVFLEKELSLTSYEELKSFDANLQSHSISMWVYINSGANTNSIYRTGARVMTYGDMEIKYKNKGNEIDVIDTVKTYGENQPGLTEEELTQKQTQEMKSLYKQPESNSYLEFYFRPNADPNTESSDVKITTTNIPIHTQRWNNITINRTGTNTDIFINGVLVKTLQPTPNDYNSSDRMEIGKAGFRGAICNITYHKEPRTKAQITYNYNLYKPMNPPVL